MEEEKKKKKKSQVENSVFRLLYFVSAIYLTLFIQLFILVYCASWLNNLVITNII